MTDYWIINCSNIRPHTYYLDAVSKRWYGEKNSDANQSMVFAETYFSGNKEIANAYYRNVILKWARI